MSIIMTGSLVVISILVIILLTSKFKINAFVSLFIVSFGLALCTIPLNKVIDLMKSSFGNTMGGISFIIIFGAIIAIVLEKSGGAFSIANHILAKTGSKNAKQAMAMTGFIPGLTIFCDTGFIILSGVAKSFSAQSKVGMPLMASILATSLYSVHCLVPTHPGALGAANTMGVDLGYLVVSSILFAIPGVVAAYLWASWMSKGANYAPAQAEIVEGAEIAGMKTTGLSNSTLPSFGLSLLPVVLPLVLISLSTLASAMGYKAQTGAIGLLHFVGHPVVALLFGVIASFLCLFKVERKIPAGIRFFEESIQRAGPILIITAAGGMFGAIIKETGVGGELGKALGGASIGLFVPYIIAVLLKTAQGSSTISILTTAAIMEPILAEFGLDSATGRMLATLAMGAGSMATSHANDSYFWVITNFSNIKMEDSLRVFSTATIVMSLVTFISIWLSSLVML